MWKLSHKDINYLTDGQTEINIGDFWVSVAQSLPIILIPTHWSIIWAQLLTCSKKQDMVSAISSVHSVHSYLRVLIVGANPDNQGPFVDRVDGIVHERMVPNESDNIIWELLGGSHIGCKCSSWALKKYFLKTKLI